MKKKRKLPKYLSLDEEQQLLDWTRQNRSFRDYVVILTILRTGLRTNELRELRVSDICADGEILTHLKERIPIPNDLREQLSAFLEWKKQHSESIEPMSFLFASAKSPQITVRHLQRIVRESTIGALGKAYRVNDLRRTFECRFLNDDGKTIPSLSPASTDEVAEDAETTSSSLSPPIHPIDGEYIREWLVLGPFFPDDLDKDFLADVGGETNIQPQAGDTVTPEDGRKLIWKRYQSKGNIIDLLDAIGNYENATTYAFCVLQSEIEGDAQIYLGSGVSIAVWINDRQVHSNPVDDYSILDRDIFEIRLEAGANRCLIKVSQGFTSLEFAVRVTMLHPSRAVISGTITDEKGKPIPNADVRLEQQACPRAKRRDGSEITQTTTDASGSYRLNIHPVRGQYDFSAISGDLGGWHLGIRLSEGERRSLNLTLKKAISIEGTLLMLDNATPHPAVPVQAIRNEKVIATTFSDEVGQYQFVNLNPGRYRVRCQVLGGYVYYKTTDDTLRFTFYDLPASEEDAGEVLSVEQGKTLKNINFRFAPFKKGIWKNYTYLDGLADNSVFAIHCDSDGTMWFGTFGGNVSQYDGKTFTNLAIANGLSDNFVYAIYSAADGVVWFGTFGGGVSRYDGKKFKNLTTKDGLAHNRIHAINRGPDGMMWFGTRGGLSCYDGKEFKNFTTKDGLAHNDVRTIIFDLDGILWLGTHGGGVSRYDGKKFINFTTKNGLANNNVTTIHHTPDGMLWFGTFGGVSQYDGEKFRNLTTKDGLAHNDVRAIHSDLDGVLWFGTFGGGVSRYDGKEFVNFALADGFANHIHAIHRDPDGVMWFGTLNDGVFRYDEKKFLTLTTKDGLADDDVTAIYRTPDGVMWFGNYSGVSRYDGKEFLNFTTADGLAHNWIYAIHRSPDGAMWFGTTGGGVSRYDGFVSDNNKGLRQKRGEFKNFTTKDGLANNDVYAIQHESDGVMWFGTTGGGASRYDGKEFLNFTIANGLANNWIFAIHRDPDGVLWFGTEGGVSRYDGNQFKNFTTKNGLANNDVRCIHRAPDGVLWFGTYGGGVSRYDGKEFKNFTRIFANSATDGLANNKVIAIYATPDGVLWFGTEGGGVAVYDGAAWTSLDTRDGLAGNVVQFIHSDADGGLWFATEKGITRYLKSATPPRVHIVSVTTDETYFDLDTIPAFTIGTRVTIEYNSIDLKTLPEKRQYRCRIIETLKKGGTKGIDSDWHKPTKSTSFDYTFDKPGDYTFEVQAIDRDLNYSEPATVNLTIQPDFRIAALQTEVNHLRREVGRKYQFSNIIGRAAEIKRMYALMEKAIDSGLTALITGETGTGKELVAKAIHHNSPRKNKPLIERNCGALPKDLVASELFGHRKGAFTGAHEDKIGLFEIASGGTVLLDEIGEMPEEAQIHLLRVLQERKVQRIGETQLRDVDVRVIAVTNRDLEADMKAGHFREDLYFRLSVFPIHVPPLRERVDDIPLLAEHFLQKACGQQNKELDDFAPDVMDMLMSYPWPGNVRELENEIYRAAALVEEDLRIQTYHFSSRVTHEESLIQDVLSERTGYRESLDRFSRRLVEEALRECDGNRTQTAMRLGIDRSSLRALMKRLGIER